MVIDDVTKAAKIRALFETDILMGISSDLFVNMVYLVPGSCVLAINHNLMTSSHLNSIAEQSQLFYLEISNFSVPLPPLCKDKESDVVFHKYSERCKQELLKTNVYVQPGMLMSYLRVAKTYTMIHKYYDDSEGEYVYYPVFKKYIHISPKNTRQFQHVAKTKETQLQFRSNRHILLPIALGVSLDHHHDITLHRSW